MPRLPDTYPERLDIRLTREQADLIRRASERSGVTVSNWVRSVLLRQARKELRDAGA